MTALVVVRAEALAPSRRLQAGRLAEVLDAIAAQTRPPDRLVLVAVEPPPRARTRPHAAPHSMPDAAPHGVPDAGSDMGPDAGPDALPDAAPPRTLADQLRARAEAHEAVREAVPDWTVVAVPDPADVAAAVRAALPEVGPGGPRPETSSPPSLEWFWLLDDTCAPAPEALLRLVEAVRRSRSVGVAGPKLVQWDNPRRLVELGRQVSRTGRRVDAPAYGEADQGQYDARTDVIAVGTGGMLVRREVYGSVGGFDPAFAVGADLDLGWRAQLAGHRVVVVPGAVVRRTRSAAEQQAGPLTSIVAERRAARRVALARCAPLAVPFLAAWILLSSVVSAVVLLLLKRPQHAWAELGDIGALAHLPSSVAARWRFRGRRQVRRRHIAGLFVGTGTAAGQVWDHIQEALTPDRRGRSRPDAPAAEPAEPGPVSEEAEALTGLPPSLPQRIATHPGFLAVLICAALSALTFRTALTQGVLDAQGPGMSGGELRSVATDAAGLWHLFRDSWHGAGLGNSLDVSPGVGVLAALTWLVQWVPYVSGGRSPAGVTLSWLLLAAMPLSALTAYLAARVATRARWGRALVALAWGTSGVLTAALAQGRVSVVIAHIVLPLVVAGFGSAMKRAGTWTTTFAAALAAGILGAFVPALLAIVVVAALVAVVVAPGVLRRLRALVIATVPVALLGPWVLRFLAEPRLLLTGPGLLDVGAAPPATWQVALGQPGGGLEVAGLLFAPLLVAAVVALGRRSGSRTRGTVLSVLAATALAGLLVALGSGRVEVGQAAGDDGQPVLATLWAGVGVQLYVAAVLGVLLVGWHGLAHALGERRWGWRRLLAAAVATVLAIAVTAAGAVSAWAGPSRLAVGTDAPPAVAVDQAVGPYANRLLVLTAAADRLDFSLVGSEPGQLMRDVARSSAVTDPGVAPALQTLASGGSLPGGGGEALADLGVGFVSLGGPAGTGLARTLDATQGLARLGSSGDRALWRVLARPSAVAADVPVPPSRVRIDDAQGRPVQAVPVDGPHGALTQDVSVGAAGRTVVFAEPPEWASHAVVTFAGRRLEPVAASGTPTYPLPSTAGLLQVDLPPAHQRWFLAQLGLLAVVVFLAVPFGTRRSRRLT